MARPDTDQRHSVRWQVKFDIGPPAARPGFVLGALSRVWIYRTKRLNLDTNTDWISSRWFDRHVPANTVDAPVVGVVTATNRYSPIRLILNEEP